MARSEKDRAFPFLAQASVTEYVRTDAFIFYASLPGMAFWPVPQGVLRMKPKGLPWHFARRGVDPFFMDSLS